MMQKIMELGEDIFVKASKKEILQLISSDTSSEELKEAILNLNTKTNKIEIKEGSERERKDILCFSSPGNEKRIYTSTVNSDYLLTTVSDIIKYIEILPKNLKTNKMLAFKEKLSEIQKMFCHKRGKKFVLNLELFNNYAKIKNKKKKDKEIIKELLNLHFDTDLKQVKIYSLEIDGKRINQGKFSEEYLRILWHRKFGGSFNKKEKRERKICHLCGQEKEVTGDIKIYTKFYITDKSNFFENLLNKNKYKSFSLCQDCLIKTKLGISILEKKLKGSLGKLSYYIIPDLFGKSKNIVDNLSNSLDSIIKISEDFEKNEEVFVKLNQENLIFDILFFEARNNYFNVLSVIPHVRLKRITEIRKTINELNYKCSKFGFENKIKFWDIYHTMFGHLKYPVFRRDLLNILESIYLGKKLKKNEILKRFNNNFKHDIFNKERKKWVWSNFLKKTSLLELLFLTKNLKTEVKNMKSFWKLKNEDMKKYFELHQNVYGGVAHKRGLFYLGHLMNQIIYNQEKSGTKGNILGLLNFDGVPKKRVISLTNKVIEMLSLRKYNNYTLLYMNSETVALMKDSLEDIEESELNSNEILFYILSGIAFSRGLGIKYAKEKVKKNDK